MWLCGPAGRSWIGLGQGMRCQQAIRPDHMPWPLVLEHQAPLRFLCLYLQ